MPGIDYHEPRARVSMRAVLALLGFQPTRIPGAQLRSPCLWMVRRPQTVYGGRPASIGFNDSSFEACQQFRLSRAVRKIRATGDLLEIGVISIITGKLAVAQGSSTERGHGKKVLV